MDLEDAVAAQHKDAARANALEALAGRGDPAPDTPVLAIRINHPETGAGERDLIAIARAGTRLTLLVPKVDRPDQVARVHERVRAGGCHVSIIAMIETARGLSAVEEIAAVEGVSDLLFGGLDLSVDLGAALDWEALLYARSRTVLAARVAGVGALDTPFFDLSDPDGLAESAARSRRLGFTGKAAIHPDQVAAVKAAFAPTEAELGRARRLIELFDESGEGVTTVDGVMVDRPVVDAARRMLSDEQGGGGEEGGGESEVDRT